LCSTPEKPAEIKKYKNAYKQFFFFNKTARPFLYCDENLDFIGNYHRSARSEDLFRRHFQAGY
jgi:hypothetical protein